MACSLDLTPIVATAKVDAQVTIKLLAATTVLQRASLNDSDISSSIDPANKSVSFKVSGGTNTVILVLFPPPTPEAIKLVEDCGNGTTQTIFSLATGIHTRISFDIIAS